MKDQIFKVRIHNFSKNQLGMFITETIRRGDKFSNLPICLATLNPEILLKAKTEVSYRKTLNKFDLRVADGFGIILCSFLLGKNVRNRVAGADLARIALREALKNDLKVAFVLNKEGLSSEKKLSLFLEKEFGQKKRKLCKIYSTDKANAGDLKMDKKTQVLFVGLGAPCQEEFIQKIKSELPFLRFAIGVGGTFDFWTKSRKRAPKMVQKLGMEWLWRLMLLPGYSKKGERVKRIFNAVFVFPVKCTSDNFKQ